MWDLGKSCNPELHFQLKKEGVGKGHGHHGDAGGGVCLPVGEAE